MPNNQVEDRYNPPSATAIDFDELRFMDVPVHDLFWMNKSRGDNPAHRKVDETSGMNTKTREVETYNNDTVVYLKI